MSKLLSAGFIRLRKDKIFWIALSFMLGAGVFFPVMKYMDMQKSGYINNIDNGFFACALFIGIVMAVFCSLFIGTEYSDGTIRNKIVVGQKRTSIYLSNLIVCAIVSVVMCATFFIAYLCVGIPLLGFFEMDIKLVLIFTLEVFILAIAFASIFTMISMLSHNKAITAVVCILLAFLLLFAGAMLQKMLEAPETIPTYSINENGEPVAQEMENPRYLEGTQREIIQFLYDFCPGGQAIQCTSGEVVNLPLLPVYSLLIIVLTSSVGLSLFRRKELK